MDFYNLEKILKNSKEGNIEVKNLKNNFYFIYNCKEKAINKINFNHKKFEKDFFLIICDFEHENGDCDSEFSSEPDSSENDLGDN